MNTMSADTRTERPVVAEDHEKLGRMLASLSAVIATGATEIIVREAIDVLRERMRLHFRLEEQVAARADSASRTLLEAGHAHLLEMLDGMMRVAGQPAELRTRLDAFKAAAARHETEVDDPLFRKLGQTLD